MTTEPLQLVPTKPDEVVAAELKETIRAKLSELCPLLTEARRSGFVPQFQLATDAAGRDIIASLNLVKYF